MSVITGSSQMQGSTPKLAARTSHAHPLRRVQRYARWMDSSFRIPLTPIKFGWDSVLGVVPGVGDVLTAVMGGWILREAYAAGVSKRTMARMMGNLAVDVTAGSVPVVGDVFDVFWKSNLRNAKLLEKHLRDRLD